MFQFTGFPSMRYGLAHGWFQRRSSLMCLGLTSWRSRLICSSPWLFAAYHVFLRLLVPRHPPCALFSLTFPPHSVVASGSWPFGLFFISVTWCFPHLNSHSGLASDVLYLWFYSRFKILFNIRFSRYNRILLCAKFIGNNLPCSLFLNDLLRSNRNA